MRIIEVERFSGEYLDAIRKLLKMLMADPPSFTEDDFRAVIASNHIHLFVLKIENQIVGMATLAIYSSPSGSKAWIEDVVIDEDCRGQGLGRLLTQHLIDFAKSQSVEFLMLTSNPSRIAANRLYRSLGFEQKQTNMYMMRFT
ncbi:MAG: GNAT family N-acetyltransferase [Tannerella sp.]|jgi:ribosomal protein S18 acetylase RimI-like enzyme|nr:GNAT family N-acetyltransferase [Tannerella sp.]